MNIKSLLLGSAALATASSGALAADAIVVPNDPEPMEYVRICDVYGPGFFYIPGTETCLKIGGYFRYDMTGVLSNNANAGGVVGLGAYQYRGAAVVAGTSFGTGWAKTARFAPSFDVRSDSEIGTVRGFAELEIDYVTGLQGPTAVLNATALNLAQAYIQIQRASGHQWLFGRTTNPYYALTGGFGVASGLSSGAVPLGYLSRNQVQWNYANGKHAFQAALVDNQTVGTWVPDIEAAYRYGSAASGWGFIGLAARYSNAANSYSAKVATHINFGNSGVAWRAQVAYTASPTTGALTAGTGLYATFTPRASAYLFGVGTVAATPGAAGANVLARADYSAVLGAQFTAARGFTVNPEIQYNFGQAVSAGGAVANRQNLNIALRLNRAF